jgi:hypothetical protein
VRAGLIARVHGIGFDEFKTKFFNPLEQVVELKWDGKSGDWVYLARHSYIAEILYAEVLASVDEKFDNIMRIVSKLNPGYSYDREVLGEILEHAGAIDIDAIEEVVSLTKQTVYFIIDDAAESPDSVLQLLLRGKAQRWPLVPIGGARVNEWNIRCDELEPFVDATYEIGYLSHAEIDNLLGRLERHECLGHLATLPFEERRKQLREIYGRQLLVALHEATKNDSFRNIIHDEFQNIFPREAQILYLDNYPGIDAGRGIPRPGEGKRDLRGGAQIDRPGAAHPAPARHL